MTRSDRKRAARKERREVYLAERREPVPTLRILKQFRIDKSNIPANKLYHPEVADLEASINYSLADETYRLQVCLHEAGHAIYLEQMNLSCVLREPSITYDLKHDTFSAADAFVGGIMNASLDCDNLARIRQWAKMTVAGGVVQRRFADYYDEGDVNDEGDEQDKEGFFRTFRTKVYDQTHESGQGMAENEIQKLWDEAQQDVEKDLLSPAFRQQIWDRAHEFKSEFDSKFKYTENPPAYFIVALDTETDEDPFSCRFRVLGIERGDVATPVAIVKADVCEVTA